MTDQSRYEVGAAIREEVLGAAHVERSLAGATDFTKPMQDLVTEYCWGAIWSRPGLSRRERSILNLGMLVALKRPHELELHVRGAVTNGLSPDEIREVLLQTAIYCGVPAGLDAFRVAARALAEIRTDNAGGDAA